MRLQQPRQHRGHRLAAVRCPGDPRDLGDVPGIAHRDSAQGLYPFGDLVDQLDLLTCVLLEQQVQLIEARSSHHPMVVLVQCVEDVRVGQELIEPLAGIQPRLIR